MSNFFGQILGVGTVLAFSLPAYAISVDLSEFPDGTPVPDGTVLNTQYDDIGVHFGARLSTEPVLQNSSSIDPIKFGPNGFLPPSTPGLFFSPDTNGAVAIINFLEPNTNTPAQILNFSALTDNNFNFAESVELVAFDNTGQQVASENFSGALGPSALLELSLSQGFSSIEIRTDGNPGIAFSNLNFDRASSVPFEFSPGLGLVMTLGLFGSHHLWKRRTKNQTIEL